jgi:formylglycine-generating enzyme required for sulfatase activity
MGALAAVLILGIAAGLAWSSRAYLEAQAVTWAEVIWPKVLTAAAEQALKSGEDFKECAHCPVMVVVPVGEFEMGSPKSEKGHQTAEEPQHKVVIRQRFAVSTVRGDVRGMGRLRHARRVHIFAVRPRLAARHAAGD